MKYFFIIDCDERGEFSAHVENEKDQEVASWDKAQCAEAGGFPPIVEGSMDDIDDMAGLAEYIWSPRHLVMPRIQKGRP